MNEGDGCLAGAHAPQSPPLIKAQTKLTALFVLMALWWDSRSNIL